MIPRSLRLHIELARMAMDGTWPLAGGTLDQTAAMLDLVGQVKNEDAYWKAHLEPKK